MSVKSTDLAGLVAVWVFVVGFAAAVTIGLAALVKWVF